MHACRVIAARQADTGFELGRAYQQMSNVSNSWFLNGSRESNATGLGNNLFYVLRGRADGKQHTTFEILAMMNACFYACVIHGIHVQSGSM